MPNKPFLLLWHLFVRQPVCEFSISWRTMLWGLSTSLQVLLLIKKWVWTDEAHSQFSLLTIAYQPNLSVSLCHQYKCFLIKWNRRAESTVPLIFSANPAVPAHSSVTLRYLASKCKAWDASPNSHSPSFMSPSILCSLLSQVLLRIQSQTMGSMSRGTQRGNISSISSLWHYCKAF